MTATVVGAQLGDEGKGRVVDLYGDAADIVVRYQGGDNAGHTVVHGGEEYRLSLIPSGVLRGKLGVLGNGCVLNPEVLFDEIDALRDRGTDPEVRVAERAHVIMPYHRVLDGIEETAKDEADLAAGTTGRGIGPTYEDKAGRRGIRVGDLLEPSVLRDRLDYVVPRKRALARHAFGTDPDADEHGDAFDADALYERYRRYGERLAGEGMPVDCGALLDRRIDAGDSVLCEGAQGTSIDIDHGVYPYVTSSNPSAGGAATGTGLPPAEVGAEVVGVVKAYLSRVGTGPLPTELGRIEGQTPPGGGDPGRADVAEYIREEGGEYGTVTGRPRRVGWLDLPMVRHAARVSGFTGIAVNHVDTLAGLDEVAVAKAYDLDGERLETSPPTTDRLGRCTPVYRTFDGWPEFDPATVAAEGYDALPGAARTYLEFVEEAVGAELYAVGVGPGREETIVLDSPL